MCDSEPKGEPTPIPDGQLDVPAPDDPISGWRLTRLEFMLETGGLANIDARLTRKSGAYASDPVTMTITGADHAAMLRATQVPLGKIEDGLDIETVLRLRVASCPNVQVLVKARMSPLISASK